MGGGLTVCQHHPMARCGDATAAIVKATALNLDGLYAGCRLYHKMVRITRYHGMRADIEEAVHSSGWYACVGFLASHRASKSPDLAR